MANKTTAEVLGLIAAAKKYMATIVRLTERSPYNGKIWCEVPILGDHVPQHMGEEAMHRWKALNDDGLNLTKAVYEVESLLDTVQTVEDVLDIPAYARTAEEQERAEKKVLEARGSYDAPGFDACVEAEIKTARAIMSQPRVGQPEPKIVTVEELAEAKRAFERLLDIDGVNTSMMEWLSMRARLADEADRKTIQIKTFQAFHILDVMQFVRNNKNIIAKALLIVRGEK